MPEPEAPKQSRILVKPLPIILGFLAGIGLAFFLQQAAVLPLTTVTPLILFALGGALVIGIGIPTLMLNIMMSKQDKPKEGQ